MNHLLEKKSIFNEITFWSLLLLLAGLTFSSALAEVAFCFALGSWLIHKFQMRSLSIAALHPLSRYSLAGYILICCVSYFWSGYPEASFRGVFKTLQQAGIFFIITDVFSSRKNLRKFEWFFIGLFALIAANGFYQYFVGHDLLRNFEIPQSSNGPRVTSSFKSYGLFAAFLIVSIPYLVSLAIRKIRYEHSPHRGRALLFLALAGVLLLINTNSRGALVAFLAGFIALLISIKQWKVFLLGILLLGGLGLFIPTSYFIHEDSEGKEQSIVERLELWNRAKDVIAAKPLTGTGINTYAKAHQKYDTRKNWRVRNYYAHNGYLQIAAEVGLIALCLFLIFLGSYFLFSFQDFQKYPPEFQLVHKGLLTGIFNMLAFSFVDTLLHNQVGVYTLWFFLGLQLAYLQSRMGEKHE